MPIKLGDKVTDSITGFSGTATERVDSLHGSVRFCVEAMPEDGKPVALWLDEERLTPASQA